MCLFRELSPSCFLISVLNLLEMPAWEMKEADLLKTKLQETRLYSQPPARPPASHALLFLPFFSPIRVVFNLKSAFWNIDWVFLCMDAAATLQDSDLAGVSHH